MKLQQVLSYVRKAVDDYKMIEEGDKIAVGISGGKDSLTLLYALHGLKRFYPKSFDIHAVTVDLGFDNLNLDKIKELCEELQVEYTIVKTDIAHIIFEQRRESNPCSLCANLRRGIINSVAIREGCNKIALGHNLDDVLETFLLNLLYTGSLSTLSPKSYMDRSKITLIRPLILLSEKDANRYVKKNNKTIMPKVCPMDEHTKRENMKEQIFLWSKDIPMIRANLFGAISRNLDGWKKDEVISL